MTVSTIAGDDFSTLVRCNKRKLCNKSRALQQKRIATIVCTRTFSSKRHGQRLQQRVCFDTFCHDLERDKNNSLVDENNHQPLVDIFRNETFFVRFMYLQPEPKFLSLETHAESNYICYHVYLHNQLWRYFIHRWTHHVI